MKKLLPSRCDGIGLVVAACVAANLVLAAGNGSEYWREDHPYMYQPRFKRLPDGKVVPTNDSIFDSFDDYRSAVTNQTSGIAHWVLSTQGRRTLAKDLPRAFVYNLVSPMDYGSSLRSNNVRRRRNKAASMFLKDNLALPLLKTLGRVVWNVIQSHYVGYVEDEIFAQHLEMMNASEMIRAFNLTPSLLDDDADEESRTNTTLEYKNDGSSRRAFLYTRYTINFSPYESYSDQYYNRDDDLPPPTLPADSYPWLWSPRLDLVRMIAQQLMHSVTRSDGVVGVINASSDDNSNDTSLDFVLEDHVRTCSDECLLHLSDLPTELPDTANTLSTTNGSIHADAGKNETEPGEEAVSKQDVQVLTEIHDKLQEYYFETGIPRFTLRSNDSHVLFPTFAAFLQTSMTRDQSEANADLSFKNNSIYNRQDEAGAASTVSTANTNSSSYDSGNLTDFATQSDIYNTLIHFYAYPSMDKWMNHPSTRDANNTAQVVSCSVERQCLIQSGVTVYTPPLANFTLFETFADASVSPESKKTLRVDALLEMTGVAFEAEERALKHGLLAPSTVWYSPHDLDTDEFADAFLGTVNMTMNGDTGDTGDTTPLHIFESLMENHVPVLDEMVSYYADTNHDTKVAMILNHSVPMLDKFEDDELGKLVGELQSHMETLDRAIDTYVQTRAADPQYQEVVNATVHRDLYNGSEYTLLGFGFIIPATNDKNVLYHDLKLPVPFHLILRLLVRFQESRLLLAQESRQLLVCLAMSLLNLSFYRCR